MKWFVWLLLLGNVLLFAYFNYEANKVKPLAENHQPISPERIKVLTQKDIEAMTKKVVAPLPPAGATPTMTVETPSAQTASPPVAIACYEWGSFSRARLPAARSMLAKLKIQSTVIQQASEEALRYWVYHPKLPSDQAAQAKAAELHALGINDLFVVQEPQWRNAISFGVFKDEQLAAKLVSELQLKGVSALKGVRNQEKGQVSLLIKQIPADIVTELGKLRPSFPGSEIKQAVCK